jgi:hypothetical protein
MKLLRRQSSSSLENSTRLWVATLGFLCLTAVPGCMGAGAADEDKAEIKLLVSPASIDKAMKALSLASPAPKHYRVYFVDTQDLKLIARGVILRLRDKGKKDHPETETTVKFRPDDQSKAPDPEWPTEVKKETEWIINKGQNVSYALKNELPGTERLENPEKNLDALFSQDQKAFFEKITREKFDSLALRVFGPIPADVWEWEEPDVKEVSAELWQLGDERIFELSRKAKADALEKKAAKFAKAFKDRVEIDPKPESKTRKAMEYFSKATPTPTP